MDAACAVLPTSTSSTNTASSSSTSASTATSSNSPVSTPGCEPLGLNLVPHDGDELADDWIAEHGNPLAVQHDNPTADEPQAHTGSTYL